MKKAFGAISAAVVLATTGAAASAQSIEDITSIVGYVAVDQLAGMTFGAPTVVAGFVGGGEDNLFDEFDEAYEDFDTKLSVLGGAINYSNVDASVNLEAATLTLKAGNAANKLSLEGINADTDSIAYLGNRISTVAAGAMIQGDNAGIELDLDIAAEDISMGVMTAAINTGNINASVNFAAAPYQTGLFSMAPGALSIENISISTTAIGALNSGLTSLKSKLGNDDAAPQ